MTSPSAAHTGIAMTNAEAERHRMADQLADAGLLPDPFAGHTLAPIATAAHLTGAAEAMATFLVDRGDASWCPVCGGRGDVVVATRPHHEVTMTCTRCRGGRLNPFHGCTFTTDDPCACTTRCQAYQPQETPTP